jgi:predicted nucleic acid-binding protein
MRLDEVQKGERVFIGANIFIYHFTGVPNECSDFLARCEQKEIFGLTSVNVLLEVLHRLMMIEAVKKKLANPPDIANKLTKHPEIIKQLNEYYINTQKIAEMGIAVKPLPYDAILKSHSFRVGYGLMVNDSMIIASMQEEGIKTLITNDDGFSEVDRISVYKPHDVKI